MRYSLPPLPAYRHAFTIGRLTHILHPSRQLCRPVFVCPLHDGRCIDPWSCWRRGSVSAAKYRHSPAPRFYLVSAEEHFPSEGAASSQKQKRLNHGSIPKIARAFVCLLRRSLFLVTLLLNIATLCVDCLVFSLLFPFLGGYLTMLYNRLACPRKYSTLVTVTHFAPALCYCYNCRGPSPRAVASSRRIYMVVVF